MREGHFYLGYSAWHLLSKQNSYTPVSAKTGVWLLMELR